MSLVACLSVGKAAGGGAGVEAHRLSSVGVASPAGGALALKGLLSKQGELGVCGGASSRARTRARRTSREAALQQNDSFA
jgi:hypothetical protein